MFLFRSEDSRPCEPSLTAPTEYPYFIQFPSLQLLDSIIPLLFLETNCGDVRWRGASLKRLPRRCSIPLLTRLWSVRPTARQCTCSTTQSTMSCSRAPLLPLTCATAPTTCLRVTLVIATAHNNLRFELDFTVIYINIFLSCLATLPLRIIYNVLGY